MASSLDETAVRHVARLARLKITDAEAALFASQLSKVLEYVEQLNEVDTRNVPPTAHALPVSNVFREDVVRSSWTPDQALHNAPDRHDGFFRVPKVLDQESS
ncbi:MAG: Asp-tRNA(Asn)/Glu-tRNA(Gln) amidotransferase subunit GatC [Planctomycetota bacterium]